MSLLDVAARLGPWLDHFTKPAHHPEARPETEQLRFRLVTATLLLILFYAAILALVAKFLPLRPGGEILLVEFCVTTIIGALVSLAILRLTGNRSACLHVFLLALLAGTVVISAQLDGIYSPSMPVLLVIPALAASVLGFRAAIFWGIVLFLVIAGFYQIEVAGIALPNVMEKENRSFGTAMGLGAAVTVSTLIILFYEFTTQKLNQRLQEAHDDYLFQANHDALTGIANRRHFIRIIDALIEHSASPKQRFAILFFDLNHFKEANDQFGHNFGDEILIQVAMRLRQQARQTDYVSRWGGDEFAMLLPGINTESSVRKRIDEILVELRQPILIEGREHAVDASIGFSLFPTHGTTHEALIHHADHEMYIRKRASHAAANEAKTRED